MLQCQQMFQELRAADLRNVFNGSAKKNKRTKKRKSKHEKMTESEYFESLDRSLHPIKQEKEKKQPKSGKKTTKKTKSDETGTSKRRRVALGDVQEPAPKETAQQMQPIPSGPISQDLMALTRNVSSLFGPSSSLFLQADGQMSGTNQVSLLSDYDA